MTFLAVTSIGILAILWCVVGHSEAAQPDFCNLPPRTGRCRAAFRRYHFDPKTQTCKQFIFGGCDGNDNNFRSEKECRLTCVCSLDQNPGSKVEGQRCRSSRGFFYDASTSTCNAFRYQGCGGNANRFSSRRQCNSACAQSRCVLPAVTGPCRAAFPRFFYNTQTQTCEQFTYGGCGGNENNFNSISLCRSLCQYPMSYMSTHTPNTYPSVMSYLLYRD